MAENVTYKDERCCVNVTPEWVGYQSGVLLAMFGMDMRDPELLQIARAHVLAAWAELRQAVKKPELRP